jgi:type I restriction-modification system DNA methylase subunit
MTQKDTMTFAKEISKISGKYGASKIFDDFIQMAVCCYSMGRSESIYEDVAKKYTDEEKKAFGSALGALILDHETQKDGTWTDYLGRYFESVGLSNAKTGQFFTPESICKLMAKMVDDGTQKETVNDPSCGSSRTLIAHCMLNKTNRLNVFYSGSDLDKRGCLMSVLNFVMFGMKGYIIHMDTLSMEIYGGWRIYLPETMLGVVPLSIDECKRYLFKQKEDEKIIMSDDKTFQTRMF